MYLIISDASFLDTCGCAAMATEPHTPLPPLITFCVSFESAVELFLYFCDTEAYDGPTIFLFGAWQDLQSFNEISRWPSANVEETVDFVVSFFNNAASDI